jgi:hypothetical protein
LSVQFANDREKLGGPSRAVGLDVPLRHVQRQAHIPLAPLVGKADLGQTIGHQPPDQLSLRGQPCRSGKARGDEQHATALADGGLQPFGRWAVLGVAGVAGDAADGAAGL